MPTNTLACNAEEIMSVVDMSDIAELVSPAIAPAHPNPVSLDSPPLTVETCAGMEEDVSSAFTEPNKPVTDELQPENISKVDNLETEPTTVLGTNEVENPTDHASATISHVLGESLCTSAFVADLVVKHLDTIPDNGDLNLNNETTTTATIGNPDDTPKVENHTEHSSTTSTSDLQVTATDGE